MYSIFNKRGGKDRIDQGIKNYLSAQVTVSISCCSLAMVDSLLKFSFSHHNESDNGMGRLLLEHSKVRALVLTVFS